MKEIAVITGASSGIGREFVKALHTHGQYQEVWAIARDEERLRELQSVCAFPVRPISLDLTERDALEKIGTMFRNEQPSVKLLINAAGFGKFEATIETAPEENLNMIDLNVRALAGLTELAIPYMKEGSEIVEIASVAAFQPIPGINVYGASKAFVLSYARALNRELKSRGIRVFAVCPFWTATRFFDRAIPKDKEPVVKKYAAMYQPEFIAAYALKRMKNPRRDYCVPGFKAKMQVLAVKILPHRLVMNIWQKQQKLYL